MSTEQTTVEQQQEVVENEQEVTAAPTVGAETAGELPNIAEGAEVLPVSSLLADDPAQNAVYLTPEQYERWEKQKEGKGEETEMQQQQAAATTEQQQPATTFDEAAWLKEKTGGQFEKWDDIWAKATAQPEIKIEDETSKTVYEYLQKGEVDKVAEFLVLQKTLAGAEQAGDEEVIKMRMQIEEPDLDDVDLAFQVDFEAPNEDEMDEGAFKKAKLQYDRKLKKAAADARAFLAERKAELKLPPLSTPAPAATQPNFEESIKEGMKEIHQAVTEGLGSLKDFEIKFANDKGIKGEYKYSFTDKEKKNVSEALTDYGQYFENRYATKGGGYDGTKLAKDVLLLENYQQIMEAAITDAIMKERLDLINKNAGYAPSREVQATKIDVVAEQEKKNVQRIFES